ncbi:sensor histidine kinase [Brachybacterium sp. EF45031]|uniref:sensor histidine kinase n=1 Tax=Brachybacterium sillae TaxID=2810536 RepID=UPI00217DFB6E|nr:histidine kinase [Brachybacterium sillae]MCS6710838.1 sensor histidine kinase [Brachybacterium sillae]
MSRRPSMSELLDAVLASDDLEEVLGRLVAMASAESGPHTTVALVLPLGPGCWTVELADGPASADLLGQELHENQILCAAIHSGETARLSALNGRTDAVPGTDLPLRRQSGLRGPDGPGALLVVAESEPWITADRVDGIAALVSLALRDVTHQPAQDAEDERARIARDLHDLAIQELFAVGMELESLVAEAESGASTPQTVVRRLGSSTRGVENAVAQIRQIVQSLRRVRPEATLTERLRHEAGLATAGLGFAPSLRLPSPPESLDREIPEDIAEDVVAVVRECLANAARHAHASAVAVAIGVIDEGVDRVVQVNVSDNGRGIDPSVTRRSGLANMASRARRHSGWVDAIPLDPGTMISWRVTLPPV